MKYLGYRWELESKGKEVNVSRTYTWSDRPTDADELAAIQSLAIRGAFYDDTDNAMIFLLTGVEKESSNWIYALLKVSMEEDGDRAGQIRYHSMKISHEDFNEILRNFYADIEIPGSIKGR